MTGKRNGHGEEYKSIRYKIPAYSYYSNSSSNKKLTMFSGEYSNGERKEGKKYNHEAKHIYEGEFLNGKRNGKGKLFTLSNTLLCL